MNTRIERLRQSLQPNETFLVSNPTNIRYLCGFTGSNGLLVVSKDSAILLTDPRYDIQANNETFEVAIEIASDIWKRLSSFSFNTLRIESAHLTVTKFDLLVEICDRVERSTGLVEKLRIIKDESELQLIKTACEISTSSLTELINSSLVGLTEIEISTKLDRLMIDSGAESRAFDTIVASGPNSAIPHHQPTSRVLEPGDLLKIDFGAQYKGYKSDCTRTFIAGSAAQWQIDIHQAAVAAQLVGRNEAKPEIELGQVDQVVRAELAKFGYLEFFIHGLGHGVGIDIHEDPFFKPESAGKITPNMVITVEPGIYLPDRGGVRIEDTGVITALGFENYTNFSYELIELK